MRAPTRRIDRCPLARPSVARPVGWFGLVAAGLVLTACAGGNGDDAATPTDGGAATPTLASVAGPAPSGVGELPIAAPGSAPTQVIIASSDLAVGPQRFAFALLDAAGALVHGLAAEVTFFHIDGETATPVSTGPATFYPSVFEPAGIYVAEAELDRAGVWGAEIAPEGDTPPLRVRFAVAQISASPAVGEAPPPLPNRTLDDEPDLARLTSDPEPDADLYRLRVDAARANGKPTVVVFATPAFCQSKVCGPVLDEVKLLKARWADRVQFVHVEVYESFDPLVYADAMAAWGLATEPWVFVLDGEGEVFARLDGSTSAAEIEPILEEVAAQ